MLENEIQNQENQAENVDRFIQQAKKYPHPEKLTPTILNDMVNAVYVHAPDKSSRHRVQNVTISYNYIGILPANLLYDIMHGKGPVAKCNFRAQLRILISQKLWRIAIFAILHNFLMGILEGSILQRAL